MYFCNKKKQNIFYRKMTIKLIVYIFHIAALSCLSKDRRVNMQIYTTSWIGYIYIYHQTSIYEHPPPQNSCSRSVKTFLSYINVDNRSIFVSFIVRFIYNMCVRRSYKKKLDTILYRVIYYVSLQIYIMVE